MQKLNVQLLGDFALEYDGKRIWLGNSYKTKVFQLLQILLYHGVEGITTSALIDQLYGQDAEGDTANNLRVTVYNLRRLLEKSELPQEHYVRAESGRYRFVAPFPVEVDALQFETLLEDAQETADQEEKFRLLKEALDLYGGHFLPDLSGEEWVAVASAHYEHLFSVCMNEMADLLRDAEDYELLLSYFVRAVKLYPFDEWQIWEIDSLIGMSRYKEGLEVYKNTERRLFEELGVAPSARMLEQFQLMGERTSQAAGAIEDIKERLREKDAEVGAYYCPFPSFIDIYHVFCRMVERSGLSVFVMLCTLDYKKNDISEEKERDMSHALKKAIQSSVRKGDFYTKYNMRQYIIMLIGISQENCPMVSRRIEKAFRKCSGEKKSLQVDFYVASVGEVCESDGVIVDRRT